MSFLDNFVPRTEQQNNKVIGHLECSRDSVSNTLIGLMNNVGMTNPATLISHSKRGIKVTKKGNSYTLTLSMYQPPLVLSWTGNISMVQLTNLIDKMVADRKKIGAINIVQLQNGTKFFQAALS